MTAKFTVDLSALNRVLPLYKRATGKDAEYVVNRAAMNLAFRAYTFTKKTDRAKIAALLGVRNPYALTVWNLKRRRKKIPPRKRLALEVNKLINARLRARAFIAAGFLPAAQALQRIVRAGAPRGFLASGERRRPGYGWARAATRSNNPTALVVNASKTANISSLGALRKFGADGLQKAVAFVAADMRQYAEDRLKKSARLFTLK